MAIKMRTCSECGAEVAEDLLFCDACGSLMSVGPSPMAQKPTPTPAPEPKPSFQPEPLSGTKPEPTPTFESSPLPNSDSAPTPQDASAAPQPQYQPPQRRSFLEALTHSVKDIALVSVRFLLLYFFGQMAVVLAQNIFQFSVDLMSTLRTAVRIACYAYWLLKSYTVVDAKR